MYFESPLCQRLTEVGEKYRDKVAIVHNEESVTYRELLSMAEVYKSFLLRNGISEGIVCVVCRRSIRLVSCILGIIKSGCAYMAFEPEDLNESISAMLDRIAPDIIFVEERLALKGRMVLLQDAEECLIFPAVLMPDIVRRKDSLLYLVTTSGTSRNSKVVLVEDRNLLCYISAYIQRFGINETDVVLQQSPVYYDGFAEEMFSMLCVGGTLAMADSPVLKSPRQIGEIINKNQVTIFPSTPLVLNELDKMDLRMPSLRAIISSGDMLRKAHIGNLLEKVAVFNMYGPTETTVCATCYQCSAEGEEAIPIGRELEGYQISIYDDCGRLVQDSCLGEAYIAGEGVARGYWDGEDSHLFVERNGLRLFRTGDFVWRDKEGILHYAGRRDRQVKIRGNKVNLYQVENVMRQMEGIEEAVAIIVGGQLICAFYVSSEHLSADVRDYCSKWLPSYMRPRQYVKIARMPMNKTGKPDYAALRSLYEKEQKRIPETAWHGYEDAVSDVEKQVIDCIVSVLKEQRLPYAAVSGGLRWEEMGIDSLAYVRLVLKVERRFGIVLDNGILRWGKADTVKRFCDYIEEHIGRDAGRRVE